MRRSLLSTTTLAAAFVVLIVMLVWGIRAATAPIGTTQPTPTPTLSNAPSPSCGSATWLTRKQVIVSVYNAGARSGLAGLLSSRLEQMGFRRGAVGNTGTRVATAEVLTTAGHTTEARLVSMALGHHTRVVVVGSTPGPGVNVYVGPGLADLDHSAPARVRTGGHRTGCPSTH